MPMISLCLTCGLMAATSLIYIKVCLEILNSSQASPNVLFALLMGILGLLTPIISVFSLNMSTKFYNNIDFNQIFIIYVMPIY